MAIMGPTGGRWVTIRGHPVFIKGGMGVNYVAKMGDALGPAPGRAGWKGYGAADIIRLAAHHGATPKEIHTLLKNMGVPAAGNTVYIQAGKGRKGENVPQLTPADLALFHEHLAVARGKEPGPTPPDPTPPPVIVPPKPVVVVPPPVEPGPKPPPDIVPPVAVAGRLTGKEIREHLIARAAAMEGLRAKETAAADAYSAEQRRHLSTDPFKPYEDHMSSWHRSTDPVAMERLAAAAPPWAAEMIRRHAKAETRLSYSELEAFRERLRQEGGWEYQSPKVKALYQELSTARVEREMGILQMKKVAHEALTLPEAERASVRVSTESGGPTLNKFGGRGPRTSAASPVMRAKAYEAAQFVSKVVAKDVVPSVQARVVPLKANARAFARPEGGTIHMSSSNGTGTYVHELGHIIDTGAVLRETQAFLRGRAGSESLQSLHKLTGSRGYRPDEQAWKDKFLEPYMGKYYYDATEIMSMGLEHLYKDPIKLAKEDPEYFDFIVDTVRGHRKKRN